ncbi:MAG TPA: outer membrane protein transport protein [Ensifer sp.]|nr:outer membrane protein transport protein [Ensifer sp.]
MMITPIKLGLVAGLATVLGAGSALAGGFSRGDANTDILFEPGTANINAGFIYVSPQRTYDTISGAKSTDSKFSDDYWIPNIAVAARPVDAFGCALTYTQPIGASSTYGTKARTAEQTANAVASGGTNFNYGLSKNLVADEYGVTCDVKMPVGSGNFHLLGGVFLETVNYTNNQFYGTLKLKDDGKAGYRLGVAYDIPEYAMRASLMYRSGVSHSLSGTFTPSAVAAGTLGTNPLSASGAGNVPQSVKLALQSGIAPGWLVYGSVEWTNWKVLDRLRTTITGVGTTYDVFNYKDGWTIQAGIGHQFTDDIAGTLNLTWDQGVGTGADIQTDTWTLGAGAKIKAGPGDIQIGGGISYLTAGSQSTTKGAVYNATASGNWAYAVGASYNIKF